MARGTKITRGIFVLSVGTLLPTTSLGAPATAILNVSYDPTHELYKDVNASFARVWSAGGNGSLDVRMSHGGSGAPVRPVGPGRHWRNCRCGLRTHLNCATVVG